jgi:hypothetical protein
VARNSYGRVADFAFSWGLAQPHRGDGSLAQSQGGDLTQLGNKNKRLFFAALRLRTEDRAQPLQHTQMILEHFYPLAQLLVTRAQLSQESRKLLLFQPSSLAVRPGRISVAFPVCMPQSRFCSVRRWHFGFPFF